MENGKVQYKYLTLLAMIYMTIKLSTILLIYKVITIGPILFTASTIIMPFWFFLGTIITETYGYRVAIHLMWMAIFCQFLFAFICTSIIYVHSPEWVNQEAYIQIFGKLPRVTFASFLAIISGATINAYILAKYKMFTQGACFWKRGLKASAIGELVFTVVAYLTEFLWVLPFNKVVQLLTISFLVKICLSPILIGPVILISNKLNKAEGIDVFDYHTNFNPFKFGLHEKNIEKDSLNKTNIIDFPEIKNRSISKDIK